jgi:hypothetical protein
VTLAEPVWCRVPEHCLQHVAEVAAACLAQQPGRRPTAEEAVAALCTPTAASAGAGLSTHASMSGEASGLQTPAATSNASSLSGPERSALLPLQVRSEEWQEVRLRLPARR